MRRIVRASVSIAVACVLALGVTASAAVVNPVTPTRWSASAAKGAPILPGANYVPGRVLVKFKEGVGAGGLDSVRKLVEAGAARVLTSTGIEQLTLPTMDVPTAVALLRASPLVELAEPDYIRSAGFAPNDPKYTDPANYQWNLKNPPASGGIDMPNAWDVGTLGGSNLVVVAIIDTGVAYRDGGGYHQATDLAGTHFVSGYDFVNSDPYADDDNGHGTHVCGTVAQRTNNGLDCAGIAFNTTIMPVKVLDKTGYGDDSQIISGITFAADRGVEVINMSLGGKEPSTVLEDACNYAFSKNVVVCAAAGNSDRDGIDYPAGYPACIAVGASNKAMGKASYSNYGADLDVAAPGGESSAPIYQQTYRKNTQPTSGIFRAEPMTGTSMATPHVSGVAALVKAEHPTWTASDVRGAIASTCHDLGAPGWDPQFGWGLIDAKAALEAARPSAVTPSATAVSPAHAASGASAHLTVTGSGFTPDVKVILQRESEAGLSGSSVSESGGNRINCTMPLAGGQPGLWNVLVESNTLRAGSVDGGFMVDNADNKTWYLAEGSTAHGFEEYILVQNPNTAAANVTVALMGPDGPLAPQSMSVPANSRATLRVNDVAPDTDVSAEVTADQNIICERAMYWNNRIEGTDSIGVQSPSYTWYLAEGTTDYGFETFLLIQNPTNIKTTVQVTYLTASGPVDKPAFTIDGNSRYSINVADDNEFLPSKEMSFKVVADQRVIAERSMYWDGRRGGHDSIGTDLPAEKWYLAEGSTDWGYDEYVLIGNPGSETANVTLTYMTPTGPVTEPAMSVEAGTRATIHVNDALPKKDVSVQVSADQGVVAERAMYWNNGTGKAGHEAIGVPQAREQCFLAEGSTDWGFDEWILIQNPNATPANVGIDYMTESGLVPSNAFTLAANSRVTVHVNSIVPGVDTSARVYSNLPVVAERSMYWNNNGAGHCSTGLMK